MWLPKWRSNSADIGCWSDDLFFVGQPGSYHHPVSLDTNLIGFSQCFWVIAEIQLSDQQTFTIRRSKKLYVGYKWTTSVVPFSHFLATTLLRQTKAHINQTPITLTSGHWNQECNAYLFIFYKQVSLSGCVLVVGIFLNKTSLNYSFIQNTNWFRNRSIISDTNFTHSFTQPICSKIIIHSGAKHHYGSSVLLHLKLFCWWSRNIQSKWQHCV